MLKTCRQILRLAGMHQQRTWQTLGMLDLNKWQTGVFPLSPYPCWVGREPESTGLCLLHPAFQSLSLPESEPPEPEHSRAWSTRAILPALWARSQAGSLYCSILRKGLTSQYGCTIHTHRAQTELVLKSLNLEGPTCTAGLSRAFLPPLPTFSFYFSRFSCLFIRNSLSYW